MEAPYAILWVMSFFDKMVRLILPNIGLEINVENKKVSFCNVACISAMSTVFFKWRKWGQKRGEGSTIAQYNFRRHDNKFKASQNPKL